MVEKCTPGVSEERGELGPGIRGTHIVSDLFIPRSVRGHIRSDNGPEFMAKITAVGAKGDDVRLCGMPGIHNDFAT